MEGGTVLTAKDVSLLGGWDFIRVIKVVPNPVRLVSLLLQENVDRKWTCIKEEMRRDTGPVPREDEHRAESNISASRSTPRLAGTPPEVRSDPDASSQSAEGTNLATTLTLHFQL